MTAETNIPDPPDADDGVPDIIVSDDTSAEDLLIAVLVAQDQVESGDVVGTK